MFELIFFKTMQVMKYLTFKKRPMVFDGLINVKLYSAKIQFLMSKPQFSFCLRVSKK